MCGDENNDNSVLDIWVPLFQCDSSSAGHLDAGYFGAGVSMPTKEEMSAIRVVKVISELISLTNTLQFMIQQWKGETGEIYLLTTNKMNKIIINPIS